MKSSPCTPHQLQHVGMYLLKVSSVCVNRQMQRNSSSYGTKFETMLDINWFMGSSEVQCKRLRVWFWTCLEPKNRWHRSNSLFPCKKLVFVVLDNISRVCQDVGAFSHRCPFQHLPLSTRHHGTHFSGRGLRQVGAGRLICDAPLVVTATHVAHPCAFATAGTALLNRAERL